MRHIDYGLGILSSEALREWKVGESFDLASLYKQLVGMNQLAGFEVNQRFYEIGSPEGLKELDTLLSNQPALSIP